MENIKAQQQVPNRLEYSSTKSTLSKTIVVGKGSSINSKKRDKSQSNMMGRTGSFSLFY